MVAAASSTSLVSIPILSKIIESSFTKEMFKSLWAFSIALLASAILIEGARYVPAWIILLYKSSTIFAVFWFEPEVTLTIFERVFTLSPGFILSGEYPQKKSSLNFKPLLVSSTGTQSSSVQPG